MTDPSDAACRAGVQIGGQVMALSLASTSRYGHDRARADHEARRQDSAPLDGFDALVGIGITATVAPGQVIVVEGDPIEHYYRILSGTVRLYKAIADGRRQVLDFLGESECFGLTGLGWHSYSVEAVSRVIMVRYPRQSLEVAARSDPALACRLFQLACRELDRAQQQMLLLGRKSADERIASFLLSLLERQEDADEDDGPVQLLMSRQDMADYLGLTIETVSRTISRFKREGLIELPTPQQVAFTRPEQLRLMAEGAL